MITSDIEYNGVESAQKFAFKGLSTDTKPTVSYQGTAIKNGSTFIELDTKALYFYDADSDSWV